MRRTTAGRQDMSTITTYCRICKKQFETSPYTPAAVCSNACWHAMIQRNYPGYWDEQERRRRWAQYLDDPWNWGVLISQGWEP